MRGVTEKRSHQGRGGSWKGEKSEVQGRGKIRSAGTERRKGERAGREREWQRKERCLTEGRQREASEGRMEQKSGRGETNENQREGSQRRGEGSEHLWGGKTERRKQKKLGGRETGRGTERDDVEEGR